MAGYRIGDREGHFDKDAYMALSRRYGGDGSLRTDNGSSTVPASEAGEALQAACEEFEHGFLRTKHPDRYTLCDELAGHYMKLSDLQPCGHGPADEATRDAYISAALSAKGLEMDLEGIYDGDQSKGAWDRLSGEMAARIEIADPEVASAWLDDLGDGVKRDAYGRALNQQTGRPSATEYAALALASPGSYMHRMREDNARIEAKRAEAFRNAYEEIGQPAPSVPGMAPSQPQAPGAAEPPRQPEPAAKGGMWDRLKGMLGSQRHDAAQPQDDGPDR